MALFYSVSTRVSTQPVSLVHSAALLRVDQLFVHYFQTWLENGNIIAFNTSFQWNFSFFSFFQIFSDHMKIH